MLPRLPLFFAPGLLACALLVSADEITLKDGRVIEGEVTLDDGTTVKVKLKKGSLTLDRKDVVGIVKKLTADQEYAQRKAKLPSKDARASLDLAVWCASRKLEDEAIVHFLEAHGLDSTLKVAAEELVKRDYHLVDGVWKDPDAYYPSLGWRKLNDTWYHPLEHAWRVCEQEVVKEQKRLDDNRAEAKTAQADVKRAASQAEAERKKLDGFRNDLLAGNQALPGLRATLAAASQKRVGAEAEVKRGEAEFEASKGGEGGTLSALNKMRKLRRDLAAAKADETKAEKAVTDQEKKNAALDVQVQASTNRLAALTAGESEANLRVAQLDALVPGLEADLAGAKARAGEAREAWDKGAK